MVLEMSHYHVFLISRYYLFSVKQNSWRCDIHEHSFQTNTLRRGVIVIVCGGCDNCDGDDGGNGDIGGYESSWYL